MACPSLQTKKALEQEKKRKQAVRVQGGVTKGSTTRRAKAQRKKQLAAGYAKAPTQQEFYDTAAYLKGEAESQVRQGGAGSSSSAADTGNAT